MISGYRGSATLDWTEFKYNSNDYNIGHVSLSADDLTMFISSDIPGGFDRVDIYELSWENNGWSNPENLGARINSKGDEMFPFIFEEMSRNHHQIRI